MGGKTTIKTVSPPIENLTVLNILDDFMIMDHGPWTIMFVLMDK